MPPAEGHDDPLGGVLYRSLMAVESRLSELSGRTQAQISGLEKDSAVMRNALHEINGKMQLFIVEQAGTNKVLSDFREVADDVRQLMLARHEAHGSWGATLRFGGLIAAVLTTAGVLGTAIAAFWELAHVGGAH